MPQNSHPTLIAITKLDIFVIEMYGIMFNVHSLFFHLGLYTSIIIIFQQYLTIQNLQAQFRHHKRKIYMMSFLTFQFLLLMQKIHTNAFLHFCVH